MRTWGLRDVEMHCYILAFSWRSRQKQGLIDQTLFAGVKHSEKRLYSFLHE